MAGGLGSTHREVKRVQREAGARLQALRDRDYDAYLKLARNAKDERLQTLLAKTDDIIAELGGKVGTWGLGLSFCGG